MVRCGLEQLTGKHVGVRLSTGKKMLINQVAGNSPGEQIVLMGRIFLQSPQDFIPIAAAWLKNPRDKSHVSAIRHLAKKLEENSPQTAKSTPQRPPASPKGKHYDLQCLYDEINQNEFGGSVTAGITWGRYPTNARKRGRHIRFGYYKVKENTIIIHPVLDCPEVPEFYIKFIVLHEMLHAAVPAEISPSGRHLFHSKRFRTLEKQYPDYERAATWEKTPENLQHLFKKRLKR